MSSDALTFYQISIRCNGHLYCHFMLRILSLNAGAFQGQIALAGGYFCPTVQRLDNSVVPSSADCWGIVLPCNVREPMCFPQTLPGWRRQIESLNQRLHCAKGARMLIPVTISMQPKYSYSMQSWLSQILSCRACLNTAKKTDVACNGNGYYFPAVLHIRSHPIASMVYRGHSRSSLGNIVLRLYTCKLRRDVCSLFEGNTLLSDLE